MRRAAYLRLHSAALPSVLVTGATGFIGPHVARLLVERGDELTLVAPAWEAPAASGPWRRRRRGSRERQCQWGARPGGAAEALSLNLSRLRLCVNTLRRVTTLYRVPFLKRVPRSRS